jgi:3-deoxy-D-manno-octulosonate 8-phosphate phosphatase (KDO 8-P phosphatase)
MSRLLPPDLLSNLKNLRHVVFDFDGVFTTNEVIVREDGVESVICNRSDGYGMRLLTESGVGVMILSTETNPVVYARAKKLKIECVAGIESKGEKLVEILAEKNIPAANVAYVGNDVNDLPCFSLVGLSVAVGDAFPEVKTSARWVLSESGGRGAVREFCELVYRAKHDIPLSQSVWIYREKRAPQKLV